MESEGGKHMRGVWVCALGLHPLSAPTPDPADVMQEVCCVRLVGGGCACACAREVKDGAPSSLPRAPRKTCARASVSFPRAPRSLSSHLVRRAGDARPGHGGRTGEGQEGSHACFFEAGRRNERERACGNVERKRACEGKLANFLNLLSSLRAPVRPRRARPPSLVCDPLSKPPTLSQTAQSKTR